MLRGAVLGPGALVDPNIWILQYMLEDQVLQTGLAAGTAGDDHGFIWSNAVAHKKFAEIINRLDLVRILQCVIWIIGLRY